MPKFSVIIPVYNLEKYLRECLDSVVQQSFKDIEIICIDDGSTDNSGEIIDEYGKNDNRFKIIHQQNQGVSVARNNGMKLAESEYITFLDSDDYWHKDTLKTLNEQLTGNDLDMLFLGAINFDYKSRKLQEVPSYQFDYLPADFNTECFSYKDCSDFITLISVTPWSKCYKREFLLQNKIKFPPFLVFEDNLFFVEAFLKAKKCSICKEILYFRRIHPDSITQNWNKYFDDYLMICQKVIDFVNHEPVDSEIKTKLYYAYMNLPQFIYNRFNLDEVKYADNLKKFIDRNKLKNIKTYYLFNFLPIFSIEGK